MGIASRELQHCNAATASCRVKVFRFNETLTCPGVPLILGVVCPHCNLYIINETDNDD